MILLYKLRDQYHVEIVLIVQHYLLINIIV